MTGEPKVLYMNKPKRFSLGEARALLPQVREITEGAIEATQGWITDLNTGRLEEMERTKIQGLLEKRLKQWTDDLQKLGLVAKGLWLVDFDSGSGYYCWRYNEEDIEYFHGYEEGFAGRMPIQ